MERVIRLSYPCFQNLATLTTNFQKLLSAPVAFLKKVVLPFVHSIVEKVFKYFSLSSSIMAAEKGNLLFDKLSELKYPNISKFNPASFDWLFDNEEEFLDWFCSSVQTSNLVTDIELKR